MEHFDTILGRRLSRRSLLASSGAIAALAISGGTLGAAAPAASARLTPTRLTPTRRDALELLDGYRYNVVAGWGDPILRTGHALDLRALADGALLRPGAAAAQESQFGTNCDAVAFFPTDAARRDLSHRAGLLCVNHEYVNAELCFAGLADTSAKRARQRAAWIRANPQAVAWMQAAHGVSVLGVQRDRRRGSWRVDRRAEQARRITATTACELSGPARGSSLLRTTADPRAERVLGTIANCAGGKTPWGTYLTAEENIDDYFGGFRSWSEATDDAAALAAHARFPAGERSVYGWEHVDPRFDVRREPNEALRFGWIVEIDPLAPTAMPKKRTALGRFSHEGANTQLCADGRVAAYMGDDEKFEYVYKFVTRERFDPDNRAANRDLLDHGTLYVARFDDSGRGEWLPLVHDENGPLNSRNGFRDQGDVVIKVRAAADLLGATPMDRPEDVEPNPLTGQVYIACTKNGDRQESAATETLRSREVQVGIDAANPRSRNDRGHIIEIEEDRADAAALRFSWNVFLLAGDPSAPGARLLTRYEDLARGGLGAADAYYAGFADSSQISPIACPDNLGFDPAGRLWIVTDTDDPALPNNGCFVVPTSGPQRGQLRQIASGPLGSEICGCEFTPDGRTLFLAIQHPGDGGSVERPVSHWPDGGDSQPRAAVVAVEREDGAPL